MAMHWIVDNHVKKPCNIVPEMLTKPQQPDTSDASSEINKKGKIVSACENNSTPNAYTTHTKVTIEHAKPHNDSVIIYVDSGNDFMHNQQKIMNPIKW